MSECDSLLVTAGPRELIVGDDDSDAADRLVGAGLEIRTLVYSRWQSFACVCLYVSVAGTTYAYGIYSSLLQEKLGFSQHGLDIVASVGNTGLYMSFVAGLALERFGLQVVVCGGGFLILLGFLYIWAAVEGYVPANIASICVLFFLSQFGVCCHVSSSVTYCIRLFPQKLRGVSVGLAKGYFALSSAVLGDFAGGYFSKSPSGFLLFIALFIPCVGSIASQFTSLLPASAITLAKGEKVTLLPFILHWILLFLVLTVIGLLQFLRELPGYASSVSAIILTCTLFSIIILPEYYGARITFYTARAPAAEVSSFASRTSTNKFADMHQREKQEDQHEGEEEDEEESADSAYNSRGADRKDSDDTAMSKGMGSKEGGERGRESANTCFYGESVPFVDAIFMWRFWVMYLIFLTMTGVGLMVIYNINAIAESVGKYPSTFFVTLVSLANGMGRVLAGFMSDIALAYVSKLELLSIVILIMAATQALHSIGSPTLLYPCLLTVGFLFGCTVSLMAINVADIFGSLHIATNFGAIDSAPILGTVIFAAGIVYIFYKDDASDDDAAENACYVHNCFRIPFLINSVACLCVFGLCMLVHSRTKQRKREEDGGH